MRQIGTLSNSADARRFASYLIVQGIDAQPEEDGSDWAVWVRNEDQLEAARAALDEFRADPGSARFRGVEQTAEQMKRDAIAKRESARKHVVTMGQQWKGPASATRRPFTLAIVLLCGVIGIATNMGDNRSGKWMRLLLFCDIEHAQDGWQPHDLDSKLIDVRKGQVWRILTPALVHYGALHLAFNLVMFYQLASRIEHRRGSWRLALLMVAIAIPSNLVQALAPQQAGGAIFFAGLSGVVFGLIGYLWMKTQFDPGSGLLVQRSTILMAIVFLALGFLGFFDSGDVRIANLAHGVGFAAGMLLGWAPVALRSK